MLADKGAELGLGPPRRHDAALRQRRHLARVLPRGVVRRQTEGRGTAGMMTLDAAIEHEWRDVSVEGDRRGTLGVRLEAQSGGGQSHAGEQQAEKIHSVHEVHPEPGESREPAVRHFTKSAMKQPTACVVACATGVPPSTDNSASAVVSRGHRPFDADALIAIVDPPVIQLALLAMNTAASGVRSPSPVSRARDRDRAALPLGTQSPSCAGESWPACRTG